MQLVVAVVVGLVVVGCGSSSSSSSAASSSSAGATSTSASGASGGASGHGLRIALVIPAYTSNELILDLKNGAQQAANQLGASLMVSGSNAASDQFNAMEDAVAAHVNAIVYDAIDADAITPAIKKANAAHIPVICDNSCGSGGVNTTSILFDYKYFGSLIGQYLATTLHNGAGTIGFLDTERSDMTVQQIYAGIFAGLKAGGSHAKIVISPPTDFDPAKGLPIATNLLEANPNLTALHCGHDLLLPDCFEAMKATHYKAIPVSGAGGTCAGLQAVLEGKAKFTAFESLYHAGQLGVQDAVAAAHGQTPAPVNLNGYIVGVNQADAKAILAGTKHVPSSLGLLQKLQQAAANKCSSS